MAKPEQLVNARVHRVDVPSLDLLQSFAAATALPLLRFPPKGQDKQELGDEGLELSLGLSLNGRFGVDPGSSRLARSVSISDVKSSLGCNNDCDGFGCGMARTCSLPVENKGESGGDRKRKDATTWRRLEVRRRRIEKLRDGVPRETTENSGVSVRNGLIGSPLSVGYDEASNGCINGYSKVSLAGQSMALRQQLLSQLSVRSGTLESKCLEIHGVNNDRQTRSLKSVTPSQEKEHNSLVISQERPSLATDPRERSTASTSKKPCNEIADDADEEGKQMSKTLLENMPCVSAKGDGPNGKRVEGFLYRYRKGEEVRIVCVCHGSFFTPAEFVKHAGGGDVAQPLKHIVVNTSSTL